MDDGFVRPVMIGTNAFGCGAEYRLVGKGYSICLVPKAPNRARMDLADFRERPMPPDGKRS